MSKTDHLPYFKVKNTPEHLLLARFLCRKFFPILRTKFPHHYLITNDHRIHLKFLKATSKTHPYFLRLDIEKYFISINHSILISEIKSNHFQLTRKQISRRCNKHLKQKIPNFLKLSPYQHQGLPLGNPLSHILAGIYLLKLDLALGVPFLRFCDDYLVFVKTEKQVQSILTETINPILTNLSLSLNIKKLKTGQFHSNSVAFLGFDYFAGYISISQEKIKEFKQKITKITHLTRKKPTPAIIKLLNNQILGFGHYYKFAKCKEAFKELDGFIRSRLRRYISRNKDSKDRLGNLILTNQTLKELRLKSLQEIYEKCASKKRVKLEKTAKNRGKTNRGKTSQIVEILSFELKHLTSLVKDMKTKIDKISKNWLNLPNDKQ